MRPLDDEERRLLNRVQKEHVIIPGTTPGRVFREYWRCGRCGEIAGYDDHFCRTCGAHFSEV